MTGPTVGLIMSGGGARAAYQVGVLRAIADMLPERACNPFGIICGTSAGSVNGTLHICHVYRANLQAGQAAPRGEIGAA
jgi:NTE family protein